MRTTGCVALLVDGAISHLHAEVLRTGAIPGVVASVIDRLAPVRDAASDGLARADAFLARSAKVSASELKREAEGGAFLLHTSGSTGE